MLSSIFVVSESFGPPHANLILHVRFGASVLVTVGSTGFGVGSAVGFRGPHAKVMQRFFGWASAGTVDRVVTASICLAVTGSMLSTFTIDGAGGLIVFGPNEKGAKLEYIVLLGRGGLGVFVRAGLVRPPSLVRSAVDARLALLVVDLLRVISVATCISGLKVSDSGLVRRAFVRRDSF